MLRGSHWERSVSWLRRAALAGLGVLAVSCKAPAERPDVVLVVDTLRADLGTYGFPLPCWRAKPLPEASLSRPSPRRAALCSGPTLRSGRPLPERLLFSDVGSDVIRQLDDYLARRERCTRSQRRSRRTTVRVCARSVV